VLNLIFSETLTREASGELIYYKPLLPDPRRVVPLIGHIYRLGGKEIHRSTTTLHRIHWYGVPAMLGGIAVR